MNTTKDVLINLMTMDGYGEVVKYTDVDDCEIEEGVVHVIKGDTGYVYPLHTVKSMSVTVK